jgi:hypothetical protein
MRERAPRYVPLTWGLLCLAGATCVLVFWTTPSGGTLYWIRDGVFSVLAWMGIWDLKVAAFATDDQIRRATGGNDEVWKEKEIQAPSAFKLKDILLMLAAGGLLLIVIVIVGLAVRFFSAT